AAPQVAGRRVVWLTCPQADSTLEDALNDAGAAVQRVHVYEQVEATELPSGCRAALDGGRLDWALIGSGNLARRFAALTESSPGFRSVKAAAISENVAAICREVGLNVAVVAAESTWESLADAVIHAETA
ncbi:MAG: uroporphyrinogen-III synthase, partial [Planctomycetota bacterium]